jgi:flagellar biosynthesis/type III secretory pathway chaperone
MRPEDDTARLRSLLEIERECCGRLRPILEAERTAAATYDHAALLACLKEREAVQAEWQRAAQERRRLGRASGGGSDPALAELVRALRTEGAAVRRAQRINAGLVRAALAQVTDLLAIIKRDLPETRYDDRASLQTPAALTRAGWSA